MAKLHISRPDLPHQVHNVHDFSQGYTAQGLLCFIGMETFLHIHHFIPLKVEVS